MLKLKRMWLSFVEKRAIDKEIKLIKQQVDQLGISESIPLPDWYREEILEKKK